MSRKSCFHLDINICHQCFCNIFFSFSFTWLREHNLRNIVVPSAQISCAKLDDIWYKTELYISPTAPVHCSCPPGRRGCRRGTGWSSPRTPRSSAGRTWWRQTSLLQAHYHYTITSGGSICLSEAGNVIGRRKLPDTVHWCHHPLAQHFAGMTSLNPFNC